MSDFLSIEALRLSMNIAASQQRLSLENIANHSVASQETLRADFSQLLSDLEGMTGRKRESAMAQLSSQWHITEKQYVFQGNSKVELDEEVALSLKSAGKFNKLAETLNRKIGLMNLAVSGGKR